MRAVWFFLVSVVLLYGSAAYASPSLIVDGNGILTGATGVPVDGAIYDVRFVEGTCAAVFGACDEAHFDFASDSAALAASKALLDTVLIDGPAGAFDTNPALTNGCIHPLNCFIAVPYGFAGDSLLVTQTVNNIDTPLPFDTYHIRGEGFFTRSYDTSEDINGTFTRWTRVPESSSLLLLGIGILSLVAWRWKYTVKLSL